jgi:type II secretion system protein H
MRRRRRSRGLTLVELMVVVALTGVIAAIAVVAWRKSRTQNDVDSFAAAVRNAMQQASRRAIATGTPYMLDLRPNSARWCRVVAANWSAGPPATTTQTACPASGADAENGPAARSGDDAKIAYYAASADAASATGAYSAASKTPLVTSTVLYFGKNGSADATFANVMTNGLPSAGFTVYIARQGNDEATKRRRVLVYGLTARPRIIDNY